MPDSLTYVTGTVKECRVKDCARPAMTKDALCRPHAVRRATYTMFQLGGLIALVIAGFALAFWLGWAALAVALLAIGLTLEM